jgi:hypothetical protein
MPLISALDEYVAVAPAAALAEDVGPWTSVLDSGLTPGERRLAGAVRG